MPSAESEMVRHLAHACQDYLETLTLSANQSAPSTQSAQQTRPVSTRNVWIPALASVERMQLAELRVTTLFAPVIQDTPETHSDSVQELQHVCQETFILGI